MREDDEKVERPQQGMPKDSDEKSKEVPQADAAENKEADSSAPKPAPSEAGRDGGKRREKNGGARRVGEALRNAARKEIDAARNEIRTDLDNAKAEVQQVKDSFGIGKKKKGGAEGGGDAASASVGDGADAVRPDASGVGGQDNSAPAPDGVPADSGGAAEGMADGGRPASDGAGTAEVADSEDGNTGQGQEQEQEQTQESVPVQDAGRGQPVAGQVPDEAVAGTAPAQGAAPVPPVSASAPMPANPAAGANRNYDAVSGGIDANVAGADSTSSTSVENSVTDSAETKTLTWTAQAQLADINAKQVAAAAQSEKAQADYGIEPREDTENRIYEKWIAEIKRDNPDMDEKAAERKARRMARREAAREYETRKDDVYKRLAPDYKSDRAYQREQNIKAIIAGLGDFGRMAAQAVTAKNAGTIMPFSSLSKGAINDRRISDRERRALVNAYEQMRQGKLQAAQQQMKDYEKMKLDLLKSPSSYDVRKTASGSKAKSGREESVNLENRPVKNANGSGDNYGWGTLHNNEYVMPSSLKDGMPTGSYKVDLPTFKAGYRKLFDEFRDYMGLREGQDGKYIGKDGGPVIWTNLEAIMKSIQGSDGDPKQKLQTSVAGNIDSILSELEHRAAQGDGEARRIVDSYNASLRNQLYLPYGQQYGGGNPQGSGSADGNGAPDDDLI